MRTWGRLAFYLLLAGVAFASCGEGEAKKKSSTTHSGSDAGSGCAGLDCRAEMRGFVQAISAYGRAFNGNFIVVPQNGHPLLTANGLPDGPVVDAYIQAIDGMGREDLFFGYSGDDTPTPAAERDGMIAFMNRARSFGVRPLVTDYVAPGSLNIALSYDENSQIDRRFTSFAATHRELDNIPDADGENPAYYPFQVNNSPVNPDLRISGAKNFLYLLDPSALGDGLLPALRATNYDVLIIDAYDAHGNLLSAPDVASLKTKANGGDRQVLAYMSIGEAETYRDYWQPGWSKGSPSFISDENPDWPGNFKVRYWDPAWQAIITGNSGSYTQKLIDSGFNGAYLDIIDAFEYFE